MDVLELAPMNARREIALRFYEASEKWQHLVDQTLYDEASLAYSELFIDCDFAVLDPVLKGYAYHETAQALVYGGRGEDALQFFTSAWDTFGRSKRHGVMWTILTLRKYLDNTPLRGNQAWLAKIVDLICVEFKVRKQTDDAVVQLELLAAEFHKKRGRRR